MLATLIALACTLQAPDVTGVYGYGLLKGYQVKAVQEGSKFRLIVSQLAPSQTEGELKVGDEVFVGEVGAITRGEVYGHPGSSELSAPVTGRWLTTYTKQFKQENPGLKDIWSEIKRGRFSPVGSDYIAYARGGGGTLAKRTKKYLNFDIKSFNVGPGGQLTENPNGTGYIAFEEAGESAPVAGPVLYAFTHYPEAVKYIFGSYVVPGASEHNGNPIPASTAPTSRTLLLVGKGILTPNGGANSVASSESNVRVSAIAAKPKDLYPIPLQGRDAWHHGYYLATHRLAERQQPRVLDMDGILVRVESDRGLSPGYHPISVNGVETEWFLPTGTATAEARIVRSIPNKGFEPTSDLFVHDSFQVEVRTSVTVDYPEIPVAVLINGNPVPVQGRGPFVARRSGTDPKIYRTGTVLLESGANASPLRSQFDYHAGVAKDDKLDVIVGLEREFSGPATARARISLTPGNLRALWKDALRQAARAVGKTVEDFDAITTAEAATISNIVVTELGTRKVRVSVGHLAAMLMLKAVFLDQMQAYLATLPADPNQFPLGQWRKAMEPFIADPNFAPGRIPVETYGYSFGPTITTRYFRDSFDREFLGRVFGGIYRDQFAWVDRVTVAAYVHWRQSIVNAIQKANNTMPGDVKGMLELTGQGFRPMVEATLPRLMKLEANPEQRSFRWVPDLVARSYVNSVESVFDEVKANEELAMADTNVLLSIASLAFFAPASVATRVICAGIAMAFVGEAVATGLDYIRTNNEVRFAEGASVVLGADRLAIADMRRVPEWRVLMSAVFAGVGVAAETVAIISHVKLARLAEARAAQLLTRLDQGGHGAFSAMTRQEQSIVMTMLTDAKAAQARGGRPLTPQQQKAVDVAGYLERTERVYTYRGDLEIPNFRSRPTIAETDITEVVTVGMRQPLEGMPKPLSTFRLANGTEVRLGELIGRGQYSHVYDIVGRPNEVIKICGEVRYQGQVVRTGKESVSTARRVHKMLKDKGIEQLEITEFHPDAPQPYLIQRKITPEMKRFDLEFGEFDQLYNGKVVGKVKRIVGLKNGEQLSPAMQRGLLRLWKKISEGPDPLVWEDGHLENIYFEKDGLAWKAGILDQDRIGAWNNLSAEPSVLARVRDVEARPYASPLNIESLRHMKLPDDFGAFLDSGRNLFPDSDFFMEKMLEYGGRYIRYNRETGQFEKVILEPRIVEEFYPQLRQHVDADFSRPPEPEAKPTSLLDFLRPWLFPGSVPQLRFVH